MTYLEKSKSKIMSLASFLEIRQDLKHQGKKLVFTNGCFDIIHLGHVEYLSKARDLGDALIVGLNSDSSVKRIKGPERPIHDNNTRSTILASMHFIDYVVFFDEDTPELIIDQIIPDVLTKGADYSVENIVGAKTVLAHGGEVKTIELVDGHSTTKIIDKLLHNS